MIGFNSLAHVRPPLRAESDKELLRQGVKSGVIDAICTHHEPLSSSAKLAPFAETQPGITAFDTYVAFGVQLVREGLFSPLEWVEKVTIAPATVANMLERWTAEAGWVLVDPELDWIVNKDNILSQGKNYAFDQSSGERQSSKNFCSLNIRIKCGLKSQLSAGFFYWA